MREVPRLDLMQVLGLTSMEGLGGLVVVVDHSLLFHLSTSSALAGGSFT